MKSKEFSVLPFKQGDRSNPPTPLLSVNLGIDPSERFPIVWEKAGVMLRLFRWLLSHINGYFVAMVVSRQQPSGPQNW
ncbi:MAG: hypothetical protein AB4042_18735 [Leptolyngbyaceae cyanobacterium]